MNSSAASGASSPLAYAPTSAAAATAVGSLGNDGATNASMERRMMTVVVGWRASPSPATGVSVDASGLSATPRYL